LISLKLRTQFAPVKSFRLGNLIFSGKLGGPVISLTGGDDRTGCAGPECSGRRKEGRIRTSTTPSKVGKAFFKSVITGVANPQNRERRLPFVQLAFAKHLGWRCELEIRRPGLVFCVGLLSAGHAELGGWRVAVGPPEFRVDRLPGLAIAFTAVVKPTERRTAQLGRELSGLTPLLAERLQPLTVVL
jgi:hypothetical protein